MKPFINLKKCLLVYLYHGGAHVYRMRSNVLQLIKVFTTDQVGYQAYQEWVQANSKKPVMVLVESSDQMIQPETIPYVLGFDRLALIQRKTSQLISGQDADNVLSHFVSCGRASDGEKQELLLLLGLADSHVWLPWLLPLRHAKMLIVAVTTPSLVYASISQQIGRTPGIMLQISWNLGGMVQTVLDKGDPLFARFCDWPDEVRTSKGWQANVMLDICITQTQKLLEYLQGRGLWSQSLRIPITVVLPASFSNQLLSKAEAWPEMKGISWRPVVAPIQQEKLSKLSPKQYLYGAEVLALQQLTTLKKLIQIAPNTLRFRYLQWRYMKMMWRLVWIIILVLVSLAAIDGGEFLRRYTKNQEIQQTQQSIEQRYKTKRALFPKIGISNENLRDTITYSKSIEQCYPGFPRLLMNMSQVGMTHPLIELTDIYWDQSLAFEKKNPYEKDMKCKKNFVLSGIVTAQKDSTQRDIQNTFENWKEAILQLGVDQIEIKTPPLNLSKGRYTETSPAPLKAHFEIKITILKPFLPEDPNP